MCILIVTLSSCQSEFNDNFTANQIESSIFAEVNGNGGYCDVSEYYFNNFFSDMNGIRDYKIYVSDESTNFDEFGIFEFNSAKNAQKAKSKVKAYLVSAKKAFESGIIYNAEEYPKFQSAKVERYGNNLVYTILDSALANSISKALNQTIKKGSPLFLFCYRFTYFCDRSHF